MNVPVSEDDVYQVSNKVEKGTEVGLEKNVKDDITKV